MNQKTKDPYSIILSRYGTEKASVLESLYEAESNRCLKACENPQYVFLVDKKSNKTEIATALEEIYQEQKIKVVSVNTLIAKPKPKRRRGRPGRTKAFKKAIVTLEKGDVLENLS